VTKTWSASEFVISNNGVYDTGYGVARRTRPVGALFFGHSYYLCWVHKKWKQVRMYCVKNRKKIFSTLRCQRNRYETQCRDCWATRYDSKCHHCTFFIRKRLSAPGSNDEVVTGEHQRSEFSNDCPIVIGHGGGKTSCHSVVQMFLSSSLMSMS
jgi:hypothetical protein